MKLGLDSTCKFGVDLATNYKQRRNTMSRTADRTDDDEYPGTPGIHFHYILLMRRILHTNLKMSIQYTDLNGFRPIQETQKHTHRGSLHEYNYVKRVA